MKIASVRAHAVRIPRDLAEATGTAGSPARLAGVSEAAYRWAENYRTVYSSHIETVLVRVETDSGLVGWGEAQSPVAPEITATAVNSLLAGLVLGEDALAPEALWDRMYAAMRVRGHTGSFLLDAIAGVDLAIWDLCGKAYDQPVFRLLGGPIREVLPCYVSGLAGSTLQERLRYAHEQVGSGARAFKLFLDAGEDQLIDELDALREAFGTEVDLYVDALWRLDRRSALDLARRLGERRVGWLEAPLVPEDVRGHRFLAERAAVRIAIGESYRTRFEMLPFLRAGAVDVLQPDIGRSGITEARKIATLAEAFHVPVAPHLSIGLGPQIAGALHFAAATTNLRTVEQNPKIFAVANRFLREPLALGSAAIPLPRGPGLGIDIDEHALGAFLS